MWDSFAKLYNVLLFTCTQYKYTGKKEHTGDRDRKKWRGRIRMANPSPGRD